ncbi:hexokinase-like protein [Truncatella angustata]|uniref:Phosphotransferase n=1 Tax=Truncatella angustata TaxID=152316 RepID=A0A9P8RKD0_9PEZI|nr:hexokinase-like protein [Truncatella angustata]KAH6647660.1 hexokinase-like protein [Truncatella angustata]
MTGLKQALRAAFQSLLRGRSFLQALFAFWISPANLKEQSVKTELSRRTVEDFLREARQRLLGPIEGDRLQCLSKDLKLQFRGRLQHHAESMLPSFNHLLPSGTERGHYLALDVGGSTLRVALVALRGREASGKESEIIRMQCFKITPEIKNLEGMNFFAWMAKRICEVVKEDTSSSSSGEPIPMGLAWSFPVEQTSLGGGLLLGMGKGFLATVGLLGQDLGKILQSACKQQGLNVELAAIVNDGSATLLSQAYVHEQTRFGLILGTGVNIAVHLPVSAFHRSKFGNRPDSWFESASHVIVNTELGMYGHGVLPITRWDESLNASHPRPEFQPLEHLLSGYYLGEIVRLALVEAVESAGLLGGVIPPSLEQPYSLDTETLSRIESDPSSDFPSALPYFAATHPSDVPPTAADLSAIRELSGYTLRRSSALLAASVFGLWELRHETEAEYLSSQPPSPLASPVAPRKASFVADAKAETALPQTKVAYNGSVIERYPGYRENCQDYINALVSESEHSGQIELVPALESSILGAAVALACVREQKQDVLSA